MTDDLGASLEHRQWAHEQNMRAAERVHDATTDFASKTNTAAIEGAHLTLRTAMLINGGAAISVLAFIGGLASRDKVSLAAITQTAATLVWSRQASRSQRCQWDWLILQTSALQEPAFLN